MYVLGNGIVAEHSNGKRPEFKVKIFEPHPNFSMSFIIWSQFLKL